MFPFYAKCNCNSGTRYAQPPDLPAPSDSGIVFVLERLTSEIPTNCSGKVPGRNRKFISMCPLAYCVYTNSQKNCDPKFTEFLLMLFNYPIAQVMTNYPRLMFM